MKKLITLILTAAFCTAFATAQTRKLALEAPTTRLPELVVQEWHNFNKGDTINTVQISKNGKRLLTSSDDNIKIWDAETGLLVKTYPVERYQSVSFSPDGKYYSTVVSGTKKYVYIRDVETGKIIFQEKDKDGKALFSPDGKYFVMRKLKDIEFYDAHTFDMKFKLSYKELLWSDDIVFSDDSKYISASAPMISSGSFLNVVWNVQTKKVVSTFSEKKSSVTRISPDSNYIACYAQYGSDAFFIRKIDKSNTLYTFPFKYVADFKFTSDGQELVIEETNHKIATYNIKTGKRISDYTNSKYRKGGIYEDLLEKIRKYDTEYPQIKADYIFYRPSNSKNSFYFDIDSFSFVEDINSFPNRALCKNGLYFMYNNDNNLWWYDFDKQTTTAILPTDNSRIIYRYFSSYNGEVVAWADTENNLIIYNVPQKQVVSRLRLQYPLDSLEDVRATYLSPAGRFFVISDTKSKPWKTSIIEISTGKSLTMNGTVVEKFSPNDTYCYINCDEDANEKIKKGKAIYDTKTWNKVSTPFSSLFYCFSSDEKEYIEWTSSKNIKGIDKNESSALNFRTISGELVKTIEISKVMSPKISFSSDGTKLIIEDGVIVRCYSAKTGELLASLMADTDGDWVTWTPEGYFAGSDNGINKFVHVVDGMKPFALGQLYGVLYRPDIVQEKVSGKKSIEKSGVTFQSLVSSGEAPLVKFSAVPEMPSSRSVTVDLNVQDIGGGIGSVYLKHNGKVIKVSSGADKSRSFSVNLMLGSGENTLEAYAMNKAEKIESRRASAKITWHGVSAEPNLYVLAAGVNEYKQKNLKLKFSVPDAASISEQFEKYAGNLYKSVKIRTLFDSDVTKDSLAAAFNQIEKEIKPDDIFVLYLAGHGITYSADGNYYYIPSDFTGMQGSDLPEQAVSRHFIVENMSKLTAYRMLVLLDTCQSGGFASTSDDMGFQRLSHDIGIAIMAASSAEQAAGEGYNGHGVFTYALLEALSGSSDSDKDGKIFLSEIGDYTKQLVPDLSSRAWGYRQIPQIELRNHVDFPIVGK